MMARGVVIEFLGGFSVSVDGVVVDAGAFPRRSGVELVQVLALAPGRRRHREQVFDALWPDLPLDRAAKRLYQAASYARTALGTPDAVVLRGDVVALFPDAEVCVDVDVVEGADPEDRDSLTAGIEAYRGELLPDAPYADWTIEVRDRLRGRYLELLRAAGRWRTVVEVDPASEDAHVVLMAQAVELGDPHDALRRFELLGEVLEGLGVEPGEAALSVRDQAVQALAGSAPAAPVAGLRAVVAAVLDPSDGIGGAEGDGGVGRRVVTDALEDAGGTMFDGSGAALFAVFTSAVDAVSAAVACQRAIQTQEWREGDRHPTVRVGIDLGEAEHQGGSLSGAVVSRALALCGAGSGGQILSTSLVAEVAGQALGDDIATVDLGLFRVSGMSPVAVHQVVAGGIEATSSPLRVSRLAGRPVGTVPPTFGRVAELDLVAREIEASRFVSVVGAGGCGKTHLAREAASRQEQSYPGGVWLCEFGSVVDAGGVEAEMLAAIGGQRHTDTTVTESIVRTLSDRATLVVLDNCEHLLGPISELCNEILERCLETRLLATSREPLATRGEVVVSLGELDRGAAVELFCAEAHRHGAEIDAADPALDRVCGHLDDLPLALRLAAARTRALGMGEIESMLADRFAAFRAPERSGPAHHETLGAAIGWSVDALDSGPFGVLVDLSVLANRFTLDAAMAVVTRDGMRRGEALDHFDQLVRRSLVSGPIRHDGQAGYRLLESVRLYARDLISDDHAADRHLAYFIDRVETSDAMMRDEADLALRRIRADWDDIRLARGYASREHRFDELTRLLGAVASYACVRLMFEYLQWCEDSLANPDAVTSGAHARALGGWATLLAMRGDIDQALAVARRAYEAYPDDDMVLWALGWATLWATSDAPVLQRYLEELVEDRTRRAGVWRAGALLILTIIDYVVDADSSRWVHQLEVMANNGGAPYRATLAQAVGYHLARTDPHAGLRMEQEAIAITEQHDLFFGMIGARAAAAQLVAIIGSVDEALEASRQTLTWFSERGVWTLAMNQAATAAEALERAGRDDIATTVLSGWTASQFKNGGNARVPAQLARLRDNNPEHFDTWWAAGQRLDPPAVVALALATTQQALAAGESV